MKKLFGITICLVLVFSMLAVAHAEMAFYYQTTATSGIYSWTDYSDISNGRQWHFTWENPTNISANRRAVVRIMTAEGTSASSLWVYSTRSTAYHPYNDSAAYGQAYVHPAGRLDNRDSGELIVTGVFYN